MEFRSYVQYPAGLGEKLIQDMFPDSVGFNWKGLVRTALSTDSLKKDHAFWLRLQQLLEDRSPEERSLYTVGKHALRYDIPRDSMTYLINTNDFSVVVVNHGTKSFLPIEELEIVDDTRSNEKRIRLEQTDQIEIAGRYTCKIVNIVFDGNPVVRVLDDVNSPYKDAMSVVWTIMARSPLLGLFPLDYLDAIRQLHFPVRYEVAMGELSMITELLDVRDVPDAGQFDVPESYIVAPEEDIVKFLESLQEGQP